MFFYSYDALSSEERDQHVKKKKVKSEILSSVYSLTIYSNKIFYWPTSYLILKWNSIWLYKELQLHSAF